MMITSIGSNLLYQPPSIPTNVYGINTSLGAATTVDQEYDRIMALRPLLRDVINVSPRDSILLLPEAIGGTYTAGSHLYESLDAKAKEKGITVLIGFLTDKQEKKYNVLQSLGRYSNIQMQNRYPVPAGMWRPWTHDTVETDMLATGIEQIGKQYVGSLICYEQLLVAPILLTMSQDPDYILAPSNPWFGARTNLSSIQQQSSSAWARLFGIPIIYAINN